MGSGLPCPPRQSSALSARRSPRLRPHDSGGGCGAVEGVARRARARGVAAGIGRCGAASRGRRGGGGLTEREREVLALLAGGLPNRAIGARLGISQQTVKTYVAAILDKLDAATRAEAVAIGLRRGLIML